MGGGSSGGSYVNASFRQNGKLELMRTDTYESVGSVLFGCHFEGWKWTGEPAQISEASVLSEAKSTFAALKGVTESQNAEKKDYQVAYAQLQGIAGVIMVETIVWSEEDDSIIMEVAAYPKDTTEPNMCSCSVHLRLSTDYFEDGSVSMNTTVKLPSKGSTPSSDYNLFAGAKVQNNLELETFEFKSKEGKNVSLAVDIANDVIVTKKVVFVDTRTWGPNFDVKIGEAQRSFNWEPKSLRRWQLKIRTPKSAVVTTSIPLPIKFASTSVPPLSEGVVKEFKEKGFMIMSDLIPREMIVAALRAINKSIGKGVPQEQVTKFNAQSWCSELGSSPVLKSLFQLTKVKGVVERLFGAENIPPWTGGHAQIALRFPVDPPATPAKNLGYHIDGIPTEHNGLPKGKLHPFNLLVGVYLNDILEADSGNLIVYPGTHLQHAEYFKQHSPRVLLDTTPFKMPKIDLPEPYQVKARAGDVIFGHYLLAHGIASNVSPNIRYALYFRVTSVKMNSHSEEYLSMTDPWLDWAI